MRSGNGSIDVVLADASTLTLDASASKWTGRPPSALAKRGDLLSVRRIETPVKTKGGGDAAGCDASGGEPGSRAPVCQVCWPLDQLPRAQTPRVSLAPDTGAPLAHPGDLMFR